MYLSFFYRWDIFLLPLTGLTTLCIHGVCISDAADVVFTWLWFAAAASVTAEWIIHPLLGALAVSIFCALASEFSAHLLFSLSILDVIFPTVVKVSSYVQVTIFAQSRIRKV